ncbi:MAG: smalltalk protein [Bacteroidaceae bacterium]|nr:smalltalk protein [Bacteroidaceae bacterium]
MKTMTDQTKRTLRRIGELIITILTALLTSLGAQSCIG